MAIFPALLFLHIVAAALGLLSGFVALLSPKGGRLHLKAGHLFLLSMLAMASFALVLALLRDADVSIVPSMLTFYLVATGWRTAAQRRHAPGPIDLALLFLALAAGTIGLVLGAQAAQNPGGADGRGFPAAAYFAFASIALIGAGLDGRLLLRGGLRGGHRLARHLWRMGIALLIATTSFFQGQERVFPDALQGSALLRAPALLVLAVTGYWLARLILSRPPKRAGPAVPPSARQRSGASGRDAADEHR